MTKIRIAFPHIGHVGTRVLRTADHSVILEDDINSCPAINRLGFPL
jgi:hypothetical protein